MRNETGLSTGARGSIKPKTVEGYLEEVIDFDAQIKEIERQRLLRIRQQKDRLRKYGIPEEAKFAAAAILSVVGRPLPPRELQERIDFLERTDEQLQGMGGEAITWLSTRSRLVKQRRNGPNEWKPEYRMNIGVLEPHPRIRIDDYGRCNVTVLRSAHLLLDGEQHIYFGRPELSITDKPVFDDWYRDLDIALWHDDHIPEVQVGNDWLVRLIDSQTGLVDRHAKDTLESVANTLIPGIRDHR